MLLTLLCWTVTENTTRLWCKQSFKFAALSFSSSVFFYYYLGGRGISRPGLRPCVSFSCCFQGLNAKKCPHQISSNAVKPISVLPCKKHNKRPVLIIQITFNCFELFSSELWQWRIISAARNLLKTRRQVSPRCNQLTGLCGATGDHWPEVHADEVS